MLGTIAQTTLLLAVAAQIGCNASAGTSDQTAEELEDLRSETQQPDEPSGEATEEQSFEEAMRLACEAPSAVSADIRDPAQRQYEMAKHIETRLENPEAIQLFEALATMSAERRGPLLREEAERAGLDDCPLADL